MNSQTSPHDNISPADTPPRPSRARPRPQLIWEHGASPKWLSLPPFTKKNNPFPIDAARCEDYPQDPTSPHDNISAAAPVATTIPLTAVNLINNQQMTGSGGAGGLRGDDTMRDKDMHTTIKYIMWRGGSRRRRRRRRPRQQRQQRRQWRMRWARWPPPDEEGERTQRQSIYNNQIDHRRGGGRRW
jgi:hypothetical protein